MSDFGRGRLAIVISGRGSNLQAFIDACNNGQIDADIALVLSNKPEAGGLAKAREAGAWSFIDAVQSAPHIVSDVQDFGCDFFVSSAYKFFGPHQGILWGRREVLIDHAAASRVPSSDRSSTSFL